MTLYFSLSSGIQRISDLNSLASSLIIKWKSYLLTLCITIGISLCVLYLQLHSECAAPLYISV